MPVVSPSLSPFFVLSMGYGRERRSHWEACRGTQHPQGRAGFLGQDGSVQRKDWESGGSTAGVLEFLRAAEGLKALRKSPKGTGEGLPRAHRDWSAGDKGGPRCGVEERCSVRSVTRHTEVAP